jgi:hypothetical protein
LAVAVWQVVLSVVVVVVVLVAEQDEVVQVAAAAVGPVPDVVGGALGGSASAALDDAVPVAGDQRPELPAGDGPAAASDIDRVRRSGCCGGRRLG